MKSILVATDGSPAANEAVAVGLELAKDEGAAVTLFHAVHPDEYVATRIPTLHPLHEGSLVEADDVLADAAAVAEELGVPFTRVSIEGYPIPEILGMAEAVAADMIVIGSRGFGPLTGAVLGSVSHAVLKRSTRPVLVVRARAATAKESAELVAS
jgi:nucleotide-binding universal stress UspA family protein